MLVLLCMCVHVGRGEGCCSLCLSVVDLSFRAGLSNRLFSYYSITSSCQHENCKSMHACVKLQGGATTKITHTSPSAARQFASLVN